MRTSHTNSPVARLQVRLPGRVALPGEARYEAGRTLFYQGLGASPAAFIQPASAADVAEVVAVAAAAGDAVAVRGGGHGMAGHAAPEDAIVVDVTGLKGVDIDVAGRTAWAGAGVTAGEFTRAVGAHGLATGFGDTASVGIAGITLGGGVGLLSRRFGLTVDDLLAAELVTAEGKVLQVDTSRHPDLFWAIRGGGGNFGVVTRLRYRLHPVGTVYGGLLVLPATVETIAGFVAGADAAPDELTTIATVMPAPPLPFLAEEHHGRPVIMATLCHTGSLDVAERVVDGLRRLAPPLVDMIRPLPYPEMFPPEDPRRPSATGHTMFVESFDADRAATTLDRLSVATAPISPVQIRVLGGAISRVHPAATAYGHRQRRMMVNVAAISFEPDPSPHRPWVEETAAALGDGTEGAYVNFLGVDGPGRIREAYPAPTWHRLREIKRRYDPDNMFRFNHNIPPAGRAD